MVERAERDRQVVDQPGVAQHARRLGQLVLGVGVRRPVLVGQPAADGAVRPDALAHRLAHLAQEPQPVLERAAVLVGRRLTWGERNWVGQVVEPGAHLDAVDPALRGVRRRLPVAVDHLPDLAARERARLGLEPRAGHAGRRHRRRPRRRRDHLAAAVEELHDDLRAVRVHGVGQPPEDRHDLGQVAADRVRRQQPGVVGRRRLDADQRRRRRAPGPRGRRSGRRSAGGRGRGSSGATSRRSGCGSRPGRARAARRGCPARA